MSSPAPTSTSLLDGPQMGWIDRAAGLYHSAASALFGTEKGAQIKSLLNGTPVRHRLHPALVDVPIGAWTTAMHLDGLALLTNGNRRRQFETGADAAIILGIAGALPAALTGTADWVDVSGRPRRYGMAHAMLNTVALASYGVSLLARRGDRRNSALALASAGFGFLALSASATIGGDMAYNLGVNVARPPAPRPPRKFTAVMQSSELGPGQHRRVEVGKTPVLLVRDESGELHALQHWCTHAGGPLSEGEVENGVVTCPWHGSKFCVADGRPIQGPATAPLAVYQAREENGQILVGREA